MNRIKIRSRKGAPGIIEVAKRAGVSPATVSRFYNEPDIVRPPTRKKIERAAHELGYIRNRIAGALHNRFSGTFGLIVPTIDNAIFSEMIEAFSAHLQTHDRTMLIAAHQYDLAMEARIVRSLLERRIDGIGLVGFDHDEVSLNMLAQRDVPVISIWNHDDRSHLPSIGADNVMAGKMMAKHILDLGHRDIAIILPETENNDRARGRMHGIMEVLSRANISLNNNRNLRCPYDIGDAKAITKSLLNNIPPSAVICGNDVIAHGVMLACQALGVTIPNDISIVGIGDFGGSEHLEPGLTTVRLPARRIGTQAAETLLKMSETGRAPNPLHLAIPLELKVRGSTALAKDNF